MVSNVRAFLQPIADWFAGFNMPEPIIHWGHPAMMGIVVLVMGSYTAWAGWQSRVADDNETKVTQRSSHRKLAPWLFTFIALGYTGGVLSLVMQGQPIFESPHFWTGTAAVGILALNGLISATKFGGGSAALRSAHAYIGSIAMVLLLVHGFFGLKLGLSI
ncbi:MAG TPA: DUF4079 domain-containing protein [Trichocoleus sp.]